MIVAKLTFALIAAVTVGLGTLGVIRALHGSTARHRNLSFVDPLARPHVDNERSYTIVDLFADPTAGMGDRMPFEAESITRQGDVVGWYRKMGQFNHTHFASVGFIASGNGVKYVDDIQFAATDDSNRIGGNLLSGATGIYSHGKFQKLAVPAGYSGASISSMMGAFVVGGAYIPGKSGTGAPCIWIDGKFVDLTRFVPTNDRAGDVWIRSVDKRGDILFNILGNGFNQFFLLTADRRFIDLHADDAIMNANGDIVIHRVSWAKPVQPPVVLIRSAATGHERRVEPLCRLHQGGICAFNNGGDVLYVSADSGNSRHPQGKPAYAPIRYYLCHSGKVTQLDLPIEMDNNDPFGSLQLLDDNGNVVGRVLMPDGKHHIVMFRPE